MWQQHITKHRNLCEISKVSDKVAAVVVKLACNCLWHPNIRTSSLVLWEPTFRRKSQRWPVKSTVDTKKEDTCVANTGELSTLVQNCDEWRVCYHAEWVAREWIREWIASVLKPELTFSMHRRYLLPHLMPINIQCRYSIILEIYWLPTGNAFGKVKHHQVELNWVELKLYSQSRRVIETWCVLYLNVCSEYINTWGRSNRWHWIQFWWTLFPLLMIFGCMLITLAWFDSLCLREPTSFIYDGALGTASFIIIYDTRCSQENV